MNPVDAQHLVSAIRQEPQFKPNKWEEKFISSVEDNIDDGQYLSVKQADCLQKIYRKSQGG